ncbi:zinc finger, CCHC-type containing protein [Tanacetum coccineum]|uniref:Zinc finger, CCHC-type containing protein n=1 Tax=Tanacetum coccineum TaxID=301880 RepID=A0ABQ5CJZ8_9ASTR
MQVKEAEKNNEAGKEEMTEISPGMGRKDKTLPREGDEIRPMKEQKFQKLYLMRRSLEVLRKFHWMILGGRFNQLSHVSSPLLSKPGEYLNIVNDNIASAFMSTSKLNDSILWHARLGHVHLKRMQDMSKDGLIPAFDMDTEKTESRVLGAVVRLPDPKLKTLGERGIECIFVGYVEHSKAFRFYVIEHNDSVLINSIIESRVAIFDENRSPSLPRPILRIPNGTEDIGGSVVPEEVTKEEVEDDPKTFDEAMKSHDVAFCKEAINYEMDSIMSNNTWMLVDLPPGCKPLGCKWIFKRKMKVDRTIEKFKARLVIQGFKQKSGIDYFDTYALVARISTIRLLIAMAPIHNLVIHQIDVKTAFLNGDLDEEVYMNQPQGFIMLGNENKVCKLIKSLYGLKQAPKQWHEKFDEVVLSNGYLLNQADKCVCGKLEGGLNSLPLFN